MITASILLGMMILPTIIGLTESALRAVPTQYYEGAVALGGTHERAIFTVVLPAAKSGVIAALVLGVGRAIGETMAVIMVAGNQARVPSGIFKRCSYTDSKYRNGDGICRRSSQRSLNRYRRCIICIYLK